MANMVYSKAKNVRMSPRKARLIIDVIRGLNAEEMSEKLQFVNKAGALHVKKVLDSALANAKNNFDRETKEMIIKEARVDEAFTLKRGKPVSKGRYHRIFKRNSHIIIGLDDPK